MVTFSRLHDQRIVGIGVVMAQDVQHPVHDEQGQLDLERSTMLWCLIAGHPGAHDQVPKVSRWVAVTRAIELGYDLGTIQGKR